MINYDLNKIKAIIFDIDGVLSSETITLSSEKTKSVRIRYEGLGVEDIYMGCAVKIETYDEFLKKYGLTDEEVMYMGDDIPDLEIMRRVGCPVCPKDACEEIKDISVYVSDKIGGHGCGRDVIEQTLRAQGKWVMNAKAFGW